jgi:hypothetical protein
MVANRGLVKDSAVSSASGIAATATKKLSIATR